MDIIETKTATRVEMLARDNTTVGSLDPAPESAMFWFVVVKAWYKGGFSLRSRCRIMIRLGVKFSRGLADRHSRLIHSSAKSHQDDQVDQRPTSRGVTFCDSVIQIWTMPSNSQL